MENKIFRFKDADKKIQKAIELFENQKFDKAIKIFKKYSEKQPLGLYYYSICLYFGLGCEQEQIYAKTIAERGANQGCVQCIAFLAYIFIKTEDFGPNRDKAIKLLNSIKDCEYALSHYYLGYLYYLEFVFDINDQFYKAQAKQAFSNAENCFKKSCDLGCVEGWYGLGVLYLVKQDKRAVKCFQEGSLLSHLVCQFEYALLLLEGKLIQQDIKKAVNMLKELANKEGQVFAMEKLGCLYFKGDKVDLDKKEAFNWLQMASEGGSHGASLTLSSGTWYRIKNYKQLNRVDENLMDFNQKFVFNTNIRRD